MQQKANEATVEDIYVELFKALEMLRNVQQPIDDQTIFDVVCRFSNGAEQSDDIAIMNITRK